MKSVYSISRGQFVTLWVFGLIGWFWAMDKSDYYSYNFSYEFLLWAIPLLLIFYSIGWRNNKKRVSNPSKPKEDFDVIENIKMSETAYNLGREAARQSKEK